MLRLVNVRAAAVAIAAIDQMVTDSVKPSFVPTRSSRRPLTAWLMV
jgi:hypothetical protein